MLALTSIALLAFARTGAADGDADAVVGVWLTRNGGARVQIVHENETYVGRIVWIEEATYPAGDKEAGKPKHDRNNPDPAKRDQPLLGLTMLEGFRQAGERAYDRGTIYNPEDGNTYRCKMTLADDHTLKLRGYVGISLLGRTTAWTRVLPDADTDASDRI